MPVEYVDASPREARRHGVNPLLWIGAFANQANTPEERNAVFDFITAQENNKRPLREGIDPNVRVSVKLMRRLARGEQVLINYGYCVEE